VWTGRGTAQDIAEAVALFRKAADRGVRAAQEFMAYCLENGQGVQKNLSEAVGYRRMLAEPRPEGGDANAQNAYGTSLEFASPETFDLGEAVRFYEMAARQGLPAGMANYGRCLYAGDGVEMDVGAAMGYLEKAADAGIADAQFLFANGLAKAGDVKRARKYYDKAAGIGHLGAQLVRDTLVFSEEVSFGPEFGRFS
jgi:TPR repeat protein